jgi:hypothetical protein
MNILYLLLLFILWTGCASSESDVIRPMGSRLWMGHIDRQARLNDKDVQRPSVGSKEWMMAVSRELGVFDAHGHGPDPGSVEWERAIHRRAFGSEPTGIVKMTYRSEVGERLYARYDRLNHYVTVTLAGRTT